MDQQCNKRQRLDQEAGSWRAVASTSNGPAQMPRLPCSPDSDGGNIGVCQRFASDLHEDTQSSMLLSPQTLSAGTSPELSIVSVPSGQHLKHFLDGQDEEFQLSLLGPFSSSQDYASSDLSLEAGFGFPSIWNGPAQISHLSCNFNFSDENSDDSGVFPTDMYESAPMLSLMPLPFGQHLTYNVDDQDEGYDQLSDCNLSAEMLSRQYSFLGFSPEPPQPKIGLVVPEALEVPLASNFANPIVVCFGRVSLISIFFFY